MRSQAAAFHTRSVVVQVASTVVAWAAVGSTAVVAWAAAASTVVAAAVGSTAAVVVDTGKI